MRLAIFAAVLASGLSAEAAELPKFDRVCEVIRMPDGTETKHPFKADCEKVQEDAKRGLAGMAVDLRLMTFCTAEAEYFREAYVGLFACVTREQSHVKFALVASSFDPVKVCEERTSGAPITPPSPIDRYRREKAYDDCMYGEKQSQQSLKEGGMARMSNADIVRCGDVARAAGGSAQAFFSCKEKR